MAQWDTTDPNTGEVVHHNTDNLAWGDQGDTRYWAGTPGEVGSVAYSAPIGHVGSVPVWKVVDSNIQGQPPVAVPYGDPKGAPVYITGGGAVPVSAGTPTPDPRSGAGPATGDALPNTPSLPDTTAVSSWLQQNPVLAGAGALLLLLLMGRR